MENIGTDRFADTVLKSFSLILPFPSIFSRAHMYATAFHVDLATVYPTIVTIKFIISSGVINALGDALIAT